MTTHPTPVEQEQRPIRRRHRAARRAVVPTFATTFSTTFSPTFSPTFAPSHGAAVTVCRPLPRRLLGVWAHPDDEAYLSAGLMARVIHAGGEVTVVTATRGEAGTGDPALAGTADFAALRERELRASLAELGVTDVRFLGIADGGATEADHEMLAVTIADVIDEVQPDAIVTFGPDGITGHPDHRAVSSWTTAAWQRTGCDAELLYAALTDSFVSQHAELHDRLGLFGDYGLDVPASVPTTSVALECSLSADELLRKRRALAHHASQTTDLAAAMGEQAYLTWWRNETFRHPKRSEAGAWASGLTGASQLIGVAS